MPTADAEAPPNQLVFHYIKGNQFRVVHADGKSELAPILDESVHHLHAQRDALGPLLGR